jgi:hypothetical protein
VYALDGSFLLARFALVGFAFLFDEVEAEENGTLPPPFVVRAILSIPLDRMYMLATFNQSGGRSKSQLNLRHA